jgi:hypothetical protein
MDKVNFHTGIYVYERTSPTPSPVLKELLQLSKTVGSGKSSGFSYVHGTESLIPHLTLWENLQLSVPHEFWDEFIKDQHPVLSTIIPLIKEPYKKAAFAAPWECFLISLMKGIFEPTTNLLVDMKEDILPVFIVKSIKSTLMRASGQKVVYLSSLSSSMWLDCAHHLVRKNGFSFVFEKMNEEELRRHWAA